MSSTALLSKGFRPFFLLASAFAAVAVPAWLLVQRGDLAPSGSLVGLVWHAHEMLFGFTAAVIAGFLLTAVANWTRRETLTGTPLGALAGIWLAGRVAAFAGTGWVAAGIELAFLPAVAAVIARNLWLTGNRRNAVFPVLLLALVAADLAVWLDALGVVPGIAGAAHRAAVHAIAVIIVVIAGRIVPTFTRNATGAEVRSVPGLDLAAALTTAGVGVVQVVPVPAGVEVALAASAAVALVARSWGWGIGSTLRDPLLWVLHLGHAWLAVGLGLEAAAAAGLVVRSTALHAVTAGSIGTLTLGMMARVALGHTGRPLRAPRAVAGAFAVVLLAAAVRVFGPIVAPASTATWLWTSGILWTAAFGTYVVVYAPILARARPDGAPG